MKDPFRVQGAGIDLQRNRRLNRSRSQFQAGRRKAPNPHCTTHLGSQMADQFLGVTTGMEYVSFGIRRDQLDPQTLHLNSGTTIRNSNAKMTLLGGTVSLNSMRNVCAGNEGMRLRLCQ